MKSFYHTRYRFYKPDQKEHTIFAISDIHFSERTSDSLGQLAQKIEQIKPAVVTISGDLVDSLESIDSSLELKRLKAWLKRIGQAAPVFLCIGNHDYYRKAPDYKPGISSKKRHYIADPNPVIFDEIRKIDNIHLLDDEVYEDREFLIYGLTLPPEYYEFDYITEKQGNIFKPGNEDANVLIDKLSTMSQTIAKFPKHKTKILLIHSPVHLSNQTVKSYLDNFDFVIAGHMHNGVVPPLINEAWRSKRGFLTPSKHLFKDFNTRTGLYDNNLIVLGAVTTIQKGAGRLAWLNNAFPVNYTTIETSHKEVYSRKPDIYKKYEKWH